MPAMNLLGPEFAPWHCKITHYPSKTGEEANNSHSSKTMSSLIWKEIDKFLTFFDGECTPFYQFDYAGGSGVWEMAVLGSDPSFLKSLKVERVQQVGCILVCSKEDINYFFSSLPTMTINIFANQKTIVKACVFIFPSSLKLALICSSCLAETLFPNEGQKSIFLKGVTESSDPTADLAPPFAALVQSFQKQDKVSATLS